MEIRYCPECGRKLHLREQQDAPPAPYCDGCGTFRFPIYSTAIAVVLLSPARTHMILIRQYGETKRVLVAGYVDKGETAEHAVIREVREELGMTVRDVRFLGSHYYPPSETLMLNYCAVVAESEASPGLEVDSWEWVPVEDALSLVNPGDLAETFLLDYEEYRRLP